MSVIKLSFILIFIISSTTCDKTSLTFVIDDTYSMTDDIAAVKREANKILDTVLDKRSSQIKDLILITVNDPKATDLKIITNDSAAFRRAIQAISVYNINNYDCPELSLHGVQLALEKSLPGSDIYVFTDASAKDYHLVDTVINLCQKKQSRVTFVLTGTCGTNGVQVKVFYQIATASSGEVFNVHKNEISKLFPYFQDNNKGSKTVLTSHTVPPNVWSNIDFTIDDMAQYVLISTSGNNVNLRVNGPNGPVRNAEWTTWLKNVKILKLINPKPGAYKIQTYSSSYTSVIVFARTDFTFLHGFSELQPKSLKDTTAQPIQGVQSHLSVLVTDPDHNVKIKSVQILKMNESVIKEIPLNRIVGDLYTTNIQLWPQNRFKIAIIGTGKYEERIKRIAKTPVEPQKPKVPDNKLPVVSIAEGTTASVTYHDALTLTCRISAYPPPNIVWEDSKGNKLPAKSFTLEPPYEYRSNLYLQSVKFPNTYSCYAVNNQGKSGVKSIAVTVDSPFTVYDHIKGVKKIKYGDNGILTCNIKSKLPMKITWKFYNHAIKNWQLLKPSTKYTMSADGTQLTIINMDLDKEGQYACEANLINDNYKGPIFKTDVKITGIFKPKLEKVSSVIKTMANDSVVISCRTTAGIPTPVTQLKFKGVDANDYVVRKLVNNEIRIKATFSDAGYYTCIAENSIGWDEQTHKLIVNSPPIITSEKSEFYAVENDLVLRLPCNATGYPKPIVSWKFNGTNLKLDTKYKISNDGHLIINKPVRNDTGVYICTANNIFDTAEKKYTVEVKEYLDDDTYGNTRDVFKLIDKPLDLECMLSITNIDTVRWYLNGLDMNITERVIHIPKPSTFNDGNYTCRVSNNKGSVSVTINLEFGYPPKFKTGDDNPITRINWSDDDELLSCDVDAKPKADAVWLYNGKNVGDTSLYMKIANWGLYSCRVTNVHGSVQRNFNVTVETCILKKKKEMNNFPLIITDTSSWPDFDEGPKTLKIQKGQRLQMFCKSDSKKDNKFQKFKKSDLIAVCDIEDRFIVEDRVYKFADLQCDDVVLPIIKKTDLSCLNENTNKISVGFNVTGLDDVYEVCIDKTLNIPLYTKSTFTSFIKSGDVLTMDWYNEKDINNNAFDKSYNCSKTGSRSCCYDRKQLVTADQATYGPAQRATFVNQLNAIPVWIPCYENSENNTWSLIERVISDNIDTARTNIWSGIGTIENVNGSLIPRYLWKVVRSNQDISSIVYVNSPTPTDKDILCENICEDAEWLINKKAAYCCAIDDFLRIFKLSSEIFAVPDQETNYQEYIDTIV